MCYYYFRKNDKQGLKKMNINSLTFYTNHSPEELSQKLNILRENYKTLMQYSAHYYLRILKSNGSFSLCFSLGRTHTLWQFSFQIPGQVTLTRKCSLYYVIVGITLILIDLFIFGIIARKQFFAGLVLFLSLVICEGIPYFLLEIVFAKKRIRRFMNEILLNDDFQV